MSDFRLAMVAMKRSWRMSDGASSKARWHALCDWQPSVTPVMTWERWTAPSGWTMKTLDYPPKITCRGCHYPFTHQTRQCIPGPHMTEVCYNHVSYAKSVRRKPYGEDHITGSACCGPPRAEESWFRSDINRTASGSRGADERNSCEGVCNRTWAELAVEVWVNTGSQGADDHNSSEGFGNRTWAELAVEVWVNTGSRGADEHNSSEGFGNRNWAELAVEVWVNTGSQGADEQNSSEGFGNRTWAELAVEVWVNTGSRGADEHNSSEGFGNRTWAELAVEVWVNTGSQGADEHNSSEGFGNRTWAELAVEAQADIATRRYPLLSGSLPIICPEKWSCECFGNKAPFSEEPTWESRGRVARKAEQWAEVALTSMRRIGKGRTPVPNRTAERDRNVAKYLGSPHFPMTTRRYLLRSRTWCGEKTQRKIKTLRR